MLHLDNITVEYDGTPAVIDATLAVPDGAVVAVLGPSGSGKSTLLRAVAGLERPSAGAISWDGADLRGVPTHKRGFALMFQDGQLFAHLSVARNVGYALRLRRTPGPAAAHRRAARVGRSRGVRRPAARHPLRRRAPAGGLGAIAGRATPTAAARRTALGTRCRAPRAARDRPARHPPPFGHDDPPGHPRPGGGVRDRRPPGRDAGRAHRAAGPDRRGVGRPGGRRHRPVPGLCPGARGRRGGASARGGRSRPRARGGSSPISPDRRRARRPGARGNGGRRRGPRPTRCGWSSTSTGSARWTPSPRRRPGSATPARGRASR